MRYKIYEEIIEDVAMEISIDNYWRKKLFNASEKEVLNISYLRPFYLPVYIRDDILINKLEFCVQKVDFCDEEFDKGMVIFKFWAKEFPDIIRYSGNNPSVC